MDDNPYAPPASAGPEPVATIAGGPTPEVLRQALVRLDRHLADPAEVAADRRLLGPLIHPRTWALVALTGLGAGLVAAGAAGDFAGHALTAGVAGAVFLLVFPIAGAVSARMDLAFRGERPREAASAARRLFEAMRVGRAPYLLACLSPTGREQRLAAPRLGALPCGAGSFAVADARTLAAWLRTFARPGVAFGRSLACTGLSATEPQERVARIEADVELIAWPQWVTAVGMALVMTTALFGGVAWMILLYRTRRRARLRIVHHLLRGSDGRWYLLDLGFSAA